MTRTFALAITLLASTMPAIAQTTTKQKLPDGAAHRMEIWNGNHLTVVFYPNADANEKQRAALNAQAAKEVAGAVIPPPPGVFPIVRPMPQFVSDKVTVIMRNGIVKSGELIENDGRIITIRTPDSEEFDILHSEIAAFGRKRQPAN